jgi:predicted dehydrogenase
VELLGELLRQLHFGAVRRFVYQLGMADWAPPLSGYSFDRRAAGGGVLIVNGSHFLDRMLHWFGYPEECELFDDSQGGPEANAHARFRFHRGDATIDGLMRLSKTLRLPSGCVLETDEGVVVLREEPDSPIVWRPHAPAGIEAIIRRREASVLDSRAGAFVRQLEDFVCACRDGRSPRVGVDEGLLSLNLLEALYALRQPLTEQSLVEQAQLA